MKMLKQLGIILFLMFTFSTVSLGESYVMHYTQSGDTYWKLSKTYQQDLHDVLSINNANGTDLMTDQLLKIKSLNETIRIAVNGSNIEFDAEPYLMNNRSFVPIRFVADALSAEVDWEEASKTALLKKEGIIIRLPVGKDFALINGKSHTIDAKVVIYKNRVYVPLRFVAEAFGADVSWNGTDLSIEISSKDYTKDSIDTDLYWLSRIVEAEAKGESYEGKIAVANVILNRVKNNSYPDTVKEVIFDQQFGYQFTPVQNGTIYNTPSSDSIRAAQAALEGYNNIGKALYFVNHAAAVSSWIENNRLFAKKIGSHSFYL